MRFGEPVRPGPGDDSERRNSDRYPMDREVTYKGIGRSKDVRGSGRTINISRRGVLFTTDRLLLPGKRLELSINWPVELNAKCMLRFVAIGKVIRVEPGRVAVAIDRHEFRTAPRRDTD